MKKGLLIICVAFMMTSCGVTKSLYYWGGAKGDTTRYEALAYKHYDKQTPESICALICTYEDMVSHPGGLRQVPPPGICAEYGYLLSQPGIVELFANTATNRQKAMFKTDDFEAFFSHKANEMFEKEMELYPESTVFIRPIFQKIKER